MEKRYLYLIVLTLFCLVKEIKAGISCRVHPFLHRFIECNPGHPKEHNITVEKLKDAMPKYLKKEDAMNL